MRLSLNYMSVFLKSEKNRITIIYYVIFILLGSIRALIGPTLVGLAENTGVGINDISLLFTVIALGGLIGASGGGRIFDHINGHPVLCVALIFMAAMVFFIPFISWLWLLMIVLLILGISEGVIDSGINTLLIWLHGNLISPFMNGLHFFYGLGALFSPLLVAQAIIFFDDFSLAYWICAFLVIPAVIMLMSYSSPNIKKNGTKSDSVNSKEIKIEYSKVLPIVIFFIVYSGCEVSFSGWIYTYSIRMGLSDSASAAYLTSLFWGAFTLGRLLAIPLSSRFRPSSIVYVDMIGGLASLSLIVLFPQSALIIWICTFSLGFFLSSIFPTMINLAGRRIIITGKVTGLFFTGAGIGAMFVPWLIGQLFDRIGPYSTMTTIWIDFFLAFIIVLYVLNTEKKNNPE